MPLNFEKAIRIAAPPPAVWSALTRPELMTMWMAEPEIELEVHTDWSVGAPFLTRGFHIVRFENRGIVLEFLENERLRYTHLSSVSRLPDRPESYAVIEFVLRAHGADTIVTVKLRDCPTDAIHKHLAFYWRVTLEVLKTFVEGRNVTAP